MLNRNILIIEDYLYADLPSWKDSLHAVEFFSKQCSLVDNIHLLRIKNSWLDAFSKKELKTFASDWNKKSLVLQEM